MIFSRDIVPKPHFGPNLGQDIFSHLGLVTLNRLQWANLMQKIKKI